MSDISTADNANVNLSSGKKIGLLTMMAICVGLVIVQGSMISTMQGIGLGGSAFILAMISALIIAQFNAMSFSELSLMFPEEGTLATYTQKAIGHFPAIVSVFSGYFVVAILALPVELFLVDAMISQLLPGIFPDKLVPLFIITILAITNIIGTDVFAKVQNVLAFVMVSALIITGLVAISGSGDPHPILTGKTVNWGLNDILSGHFVGLIALAMWLFVGSEYICPMIKEVKNPIKDIPLAMQLSLFAIFLMFSAFVYGASLYLNTNTLIKSSIPYLNYANAVFGKPGLAIATVMALAATCSTVNTIFAALPRMLHGMAMEKQAFPILKITNRFGTPWVGIVMVAALTCITFLVMKSNELIILVIAATTSYLLAYIIAHINVIVLRRRMPNHTRPYRTPFYPLPQILGIAAMIYVALNNSPAPEMTRLVYSIAGSMLAIICIIAAFWVKFYMKRGLFEPDVD